VAVPTRAELVVHRPGRPGKPGLRVAIIELLKSSGKAHTATDIIVKLNLPKTKNASVRTTLWQLANEGRVKKDKVRGYRAA
jgi:Fe2+ or Zn2+ uptake regulation protein